MIFLFKTPKLFAFTSVPLWALIVVLGRLFVFTEYTSTMTGILYPVLAFVCGAYVLVMLAAFSANKTHRSYNEILSQECDADRFVSLYEPIREEGRKHAGTVYLTESSYATGIHLTGRSDEAREIVRALIAREDFSRRRAVDRADAHIDAGIYSLALGDMEETRASIERAEEILSEMAVGTPEYNRIYREITRLRHRADIADGKFDEAREYFTDTTREYTVPYTKVNRMNTLAQIYRATGELRNLKKCLTYIAENGGTLKMAKDARAELETLPALPPEPEREEDEDE